MEPTPSQQIDYRRLLKRAYLSLERYKARVARLERERSEPVAVVGLGCRFPGGANGAEAFWRVLRDGEDAIIEVPGNRWNINDYYDPDPNAPDKMYSRWGGFIDDIEQFDPSFFGISPREADKMDPQQRKLLEVSWEAMERAGMAPLDPAGARTGVFVGVGANEYAQLIWDNEAAGLHDLLHATGNSASVASGRLSYCFGLRGPSLSIDTACSSSLVAVHLAIQSLRRRECDAALAGGVSSILSPTLTALLCKSRMLSFDGRCKTFDASADGYVRGEGCGMVVLKRLDDALHNRDHVLAVLRGSAVNQDGRSSGLTAPNGVAQEEVLRAALKNANVEPGELSYLEAHGTGTPLGDPIEIRAISAVFGEQHSAAKPLYIGSVKTNIGHLESAAGIAGLIKTILALQHKTIPAHLHFSQPNPHIPWEQISCIVPTRAAHWSAEGPRLAGVSSFGFSGTNAHVIVEEAPPRPDRPGPDRPVHILALSAKSGPALQQLAERYVNHFAGEDRPAPGDACYTAACGRPHFQHRLAVVGDSIDRLRHNLAHFVTRQAQDDAKSAVVPNEGPPKLAFLFTGQGSQYPGMAHQLFESQAVFRAALEHCAELFRPYLERPLLSLLYPAPLAEDDASSLLHQTAYTQPALFAVEYALAQLWKSWGVEPAVVLGHSVGECAAACVAGIFSVEDGVKLVAQRARLMQALPRGGAMAAVFAPKSRVAAAIASCGDSVSIASLNGPENTVISGAAETMEGILRQLKSEGIESKRLNVSHAFHSPLMEPMLDDFERAAREVSFCEPRLGLISNVTGRLATRDQVSNASYWRQHVRAPVQFSLAMQSLQERGCGLFLEIGPHPTLLAMGRRCAAGCSAAWLPSLRKGRDDWRQLLESLSALYVAGVEIDWPGFDRDYPRRRVPLPTYPFQRGQYWFEPGLRRSNVAPPSSRNACGHHRLLGNRICSPRLEATLFQSQVSADSPSFLRDHLVLGAMVFPTGAYLETVLSGALRAFGPRSLVIEDIVIESPLVFRKADQRTLQLIFTPRNDERYSFEIFSRPGHHDNGESTWLRHVSGQLRMAVDNGDDAAATDSPLLAELQNRCPQAIDVGQFYEAACERQIEFGPSYQVLEQLWTGSHESLGRIRLPETLAEESAEFAFHPVLLDACFQVLGTVPFGGDDAQQRDGAFVPVSVERLRTFGAAPKELWTHARLRPPIPDRQETVTADLRGYDDAGRLVLEISGITRTRVTRNSLLKRLDDAASESPTRDPLQPSKDDAVALQGQLASAAESEWQGILSAVVRARASQILGIGNPESLDVHQPLATLGLDSLMAIELRNRLEAAIDAALPVIKYIAGPSVWELAGMLVESLSTSSGVLPYGAVACPHEPRWEEGEL